MADTQTKEGTIVINGWHNIMEPDRRKVDIETVLTAFNAHAEEDVVAAKEIKDEIAKVKDIHDRDQTTRRGFENTVNHVLFGSKKLGEAGMKSKVDEMHARMGILITQNAELVRVLTGDKLTGTPGLIEDIKPIINAHKAIKWTFAIGLALGGAILMYYNLIKVK